jgi:hypothetical protein
MSPPYTHYRVRQLIALGELLLNAIDYVIRFFDRRRP